MLLNSIQIILEAFGIIFILLTVYATFEYAMNKYYEKKIKPLEDAINKLTEKK